MVDAGEFLIARNPDTESSLPYLVRIPLRPEPMIVATKDVWPRTAKLYCHRLDEWPDDLDDDDIVQRVAVRSCVRRGAAVDLVLDRGRESRSMFVHARARGREMIFWQSARTAKQARPTGSVPTARSAAGALTITVDAHEQYAWSFAGQQATTRRAALPVGDYGVHDVDGRLVAAVERKSLADLVTTMTGGKLRYVLAALSELDRAALVVEDRYSQILKLGRVRPSVILDGLGEAQARFPSVPIVFAETRPLAQEWTYRFLGAALAHRHEHSDGVAPLIAARAPASDRSSSAVRAWALATGLRVPARGPMPKAVVAAFDIAHPLT
jgi:hypothetical protein